MTHLPFRMPLGSPEVKLIGITGTYGNVLVEQGVRNALAVTDLLGHPEVKVYQGLPHSSTTDHFEVLPDLRIHPRRQRNR